jgi:hypothetical protein
MHRVFIIGFDQPHLFPNLEIAHAHGTSFRFRFDHRSVLQLHLEPGSDHSTQQHILLVETNDFALDVVLHLVKFDAEKEQ